MLKRILIVALMLSVTGCARTAQRQGLPAPSEYIGKTYYASEPLAYQLNLPRYQNTRRYIRDNSRTLFAEEVDRQITDIVPDCSGCMSADRLITTIRLTFIPTNTPIKVVDEYIFHQSRGWLRPDINRHMLIVKDSAGHYSEISALIFDTRFKLQPDSSQRLSIEQQHILKHITQFKPHGGKLTLNFCLAKYVDPKITPAAFIRDFKLTDEVSWTERSTMCEHNFELTFQNVSAYLTASYYFRGWGLFGQWFWVQHMKT